MCLKLCCHISSIILYSSVLLLSRGCFHLAPDKCNSQSRFSINTWLIEIQILDFCDNTLMVLQYYNCCFSPFSLNLQFQRQDDFLLVPGFKGSFSQLSCLSKVQAILLSKAYSEVSDHFRAGPSYYLLSHMCDPRVLMT